MKYAGMPWGMWVLFHRSFRRQLTETLGYSAEESRRITTETKPEYKRIIANLPDWEKGDRFQMNIVNAAMLGAFLLKLPKRPDVEKTTGFYRDSMMTCVMRLFCWMSGRQKFTDKDIAAMKATAALRAGDRNPYSWNMEFLPYADDSGYEARFTSCGICTLMKELGLYDLVPAMCKLDYTMSQAGGASIFIRKYTLASGGLYCDCGYKKKAGRI